MGKYGGDSRSRLPSPEGLTKKWQRKSAAYLLDVVKAGFKVEVSTVDRQKGASKILLVPTYTEVQKATTADQGMCFAWAYEIKQASPVVRTALTTRDVMVSGIPDVNTPGYGTAERPIEPYYDRLFRGGDLLLRPFIVNEQIVETCDELRLGRLVGLDLISRRIFNVW